jgi:hypothetical protein
LFVFSFAVRFSELSDRDFILLDCCCFFD